MDYLSKRAKKIKPYVAGMQPSGNIIKLNTNENPYPPSDKLKDALNSMDISNLRLYPKTDGGQARIAAAELNGVKTKNIFCANGSDEAIALAFYAFFEDVLLMPEITYSFYPVWADLFEIKFKRVKMNGDLSVNIKGLFNSSGGVVLANPNAPTGIALDLNQIEEILKNNDKVVLIDEAYFGFGADSALPLMEKYKNLLVARTLSKTHSGAGLRFGYIIGSQELISGLERVRDSFNSYPTDTISQILAENALSDIDYTEKIARKVCAAREILSGELKKLGFSVCPSSANFVFVKHESLSAVKIYDELIKRDIYVRHFNQPKISEYLRITVGTEEQTKELINSLKQIITQ